jgi:hypothetical protein
LVIADLRLGGFNGLQLLLLSPRPIPTIIITGFPDQVLEAEARRAGADLRRQAHLSIRTRRIGERETEDRSTHDALAARVPRFCFPADKAHASWQRVSSLLEVITEILYEIAPRGFPEPRYLPCQHTAASAARSSRPRFVSRYRCSVGAVMLGYHSNQVQKAC